MLRAVLPGALWEKGGRAFSAGGSALSGIPEGYARFRRKHDGEKYAGLVYHPFFLRGKCTSADGSVLLEIKQKAADRAKFLGKIVNGNREWPYKLFEKMYVNFNKMQKEHQDKGEWLDSWKVEINPDHREEGFCFHLVGCPIAKHAKSHGYGELLPYLCQTDHFLAEVMHARLIRTKTEALGGNCCDYWYVGDQSPALTEYEDLPKI